MLAYFVSHSQTYYVDQNATGNGSGDSWTNAFTSLESALALQESGFTGEIRVAGGQTFYPSASRLCTSGCISPRDYYFLIHEDIQLKGSYDVSTNTQDYSNPTILSGDIGVTNENNDNTYHVIVTNYLSNDAIIDGFVITIGLANNTESSNVNGNEIYKGRGAGMYNNSSSPIASNIIFSENSAIYEGGGMYNILSNPNIFNTVFSENSADVAGGGIYNNHSSPSISNATFSMNISNYGGGIFNQNNSNSTIYNTVLHNNTPTDIYNDATSFITASSANNFSETSYLVGNSFTQLTANPFVDSNDPIGADGIWNTADDGLYPANGSVLLNTGDNNFNTQNTDITGNLRVLFDTIDVGAYEGLVPNLQPDENNILYVNKNASGGDSSGNSWANAVTELAEASLWANSIQDVAWQTSPLQIWVATGTYTPGTEQTDSFTIPSNVIVLGGFNGTETTDDERNWAENPTILSGDLNNSLTENPGDSHTIVTMLGNNAEINGFYIQWGYADDGTNNSQPAIGRSGAGVYNNGDNRIYNCTIRSNVADTSDDPEIGIGAGLVSFGGTLDIINTLFNSNTASANGGAISAESGTINLINCTVADNAANKGGGIHFYNGSINATNTILTNNSGTNGNVNNDGGAGTGTANYCLFYNETNGNNGSLPPNITGNNNLEETNPIYINGYKLKYNSPAADVGNNSVNNLTRDLNAQNRIKNTIIDIGAYEVIDTCIDLENTVYVDQNATGNNDGSDWSNAFTSLETALALQETCNFTGEIRVAGGQTFYPSTSRLCTSGCNDNRDNYFLIHEDIQLKGSYVVGTDTQDYSNPTILSGDIGNLNDNNDNTLRVVLATNLSNIALIDGFTITQGNANGSGYSNIDSVLIFNNSGGGMYNRNSSLRITNATFVNNSANRGGGLNNYTASPSIINATFVNNSVSNYGGGMYSFDSSLSITNATFVNNSAINGGGLANFESSLSITNATFVNNSATTNGDALYNSITSNISLYNTVLYANIGSEIYNGNDSYISSSSANNFSETFTNTGFTQLTADPFVDSSNPIGADGIWGTADDGLYPATGSVLINAGDNSFNTESTDITGSPRVHDTAIDVGAYEYNYSCEPNPIVSTTADDGPGSLRDAIENACENAVITFDSSINGNTIILTSGEIIIDKDLTLTGNGLENTIISGGNNSRIFNIQNQDVIIESISVQNGIVPPSGDLEDISGGAIYAFESNITINYCQFNGNIANIGGAIAFHGLQPQSGEVLADVSMNNLTILNSTFQNNYSNTGGALETRYANTNIENTLFSGNRATTQGGALYLFTSITSVTNITVSGNYANNYNGGLFAYIPTSGNIGESFTMTNSVVSGNDAGLAFSNMGQCTSCNISYSLNGDFNNLGEGNLTMETDPLFENPIQANTAPNLNGDYSLTTASPLVNAGTNSTLPVFNVDLANNPRIFDTAIDIGAYELQSTLSNDKVSNTKIMVYPNPTNNILHIKTNIKEYSYELYNIQGQKVMKSKKTVHTINTSQLASGVYILKINSKNKTQSIKVIKQLQ